MPPSPERPLNDFERERDAMLEVVRKKIAEEGRTFNYAKKEDLVKALDEFIEKVLEDQGIEKKYDPGYSHSPEVKEKLVIKSGIGIALKNSIRGRLEKDYGTFGQKTEIEATNKEKVGAGDDVASKRYDIIQDRNTKEVKRMTDEDGSTYFEQVPEK